MHNLHNKLLCVCVCACFSLKGAGFPLHLLPQCVPSGGVAGQTCSEWHGIPAGTPVGAALGDFQCSVYSCMSARTDAGETGSHVSADRFIPAAEILSSYSRHSLVSMTVLQMQLTCTPSSTAQSAKIKALLSFAHD